MGSLSLSLAQQRYTWASYFFGQKVHILCSQTKSFHKHMCAVHICSKLHVLCRLRRKAVITWEIFGVSWIMITDSICVPSISLLSPSSYLCLPGQCPIKMPVSLHGKLEAFWSLPTLCKWRGIDIISGPEMLCRCVNTISIWGQLA